MNSTPGIPVNQQVPVWKKDIEINFKNLFNSQGKAVVNSGFAKWDGFSGNAVDTLHELGLKADTGQVTWLLIYRSLMQAMFSLVEENQELLLKKPEYEDLCDRLDNSLQNIALFINHNFFLHPKNLPVIEAIKTPFVQYLESCGLTTSVAQTLSDRLPAYFLYALNQLWVNHPQDYACLQEQLDTIFTQASQQEQAWFLYATWLQKHAEEPMFLEAFSLRQVYVPLRAYYKRKSKGQKEEEFERWVTEEKQYERVVVDLESELTDWLNETDPNDAIRFLAGEAGTGKSSFVKIFAAKQAEKRELHVLLIPLHHLEFSHDLVDAVGKFVHSDNFLRYNPLAQDNYESRLLIIFDGLNDLGMHSKIATEVPQKFVREVQRKVEQFNSRQTHLQVLITGRELVVQANNTDFRQPKQVLHILPYFVANEERNEYIDDQNLLSQDQRQIWWQLYGKATGREYVDLPAELDKGKLTEITSQPLLNYLVALSLVRGKLKLTQNTNINAIYEDLLKAVYERGWGNYQSPLLHSIQEKDFFRILEEIALVSWHRNGLISTVREIEKYSNNSALKRLLDIFKQGEKNKLSRLLINFDNRKNSISQSDKIFEFTHKNFSEYLTARRIVREVRHIYEMLKRRQNDPDDGWEEEDALQRWAILCGFSSMDDYLFNFVLDEIGLHNSSDVGNWQQTLSHLISVMLSHGMPMERLHPRPNFQEENRLSRNAEEALLATLNACARLTRTVSEINWHTPETFGAWLAKLQGQRIGANVFALNCLSFLNLQACILYIKDFYNANLEGANLERANLTGAYLEGAYLYRANLEGANLEGAYLYRANLEGAYIYRANLKRVNLVGANLVGAYLEAVNLEGANLVGANMLATNLVAANLKRANMLAAYFEGANLLEANMEGVYLKRANLVGTYLYKTNLERANLERANLVGAYLERANLERANLERAYLKRANLVGAYLVATNLEQANLEGVYLVGANLEGANLVGTNLEGANLKRANLLGANLLEANLRGTILQNKDLSDDSVSATEES